MILDDLRQQTASTILSHILELQAWAEDLSSSSTSRGRPPRGFATPTSPRQESSLKPFASIPPAGRYIFQAPIPPALADDLKAVGTSKKSSKIAFDFPMLEMKPDKETASGSIRIVDQAKFKVSRRITMAYVVIKPGALRELHWHTNADEWQYYISGRGRMTLFKNHSDARTINFTASDVGYVPVTMPHYVENIGNEDLVYLEMFRAPNYTDISLNEWLGALPPELVKQHLSLDDAVLSAIPKTNEGVLPL